MSDIASVREILTKAREDLKGDHTFDIPLLGYEQVNVTVRYRPLEYAVTRTIGMAAEKVKPASAQEIQVAMDTLAESSMDILVNDESTGQRFNVEGAKLFGVDLPDGAFARDAVYQIFDGKTDLLMDHFGRWLVERELAYVKIEEDVEDLSEASSVALSTSQPE